MFTTRLFPRPLRINLMGLIIAMEEKIMKMEFRIYPKIYQCKFIPSFMKAWSGKLWYFDFWRLGLVLDFRKNWIKDMIGNHKE